MKNVTIGGGIVRQLSDPEGSLRYFLIRSLTDSGEVYSIFAISATGASFYFDVKGADRLVEKLIRGGVSPEYLGEVLEELC